MIKATIEETSEGKVLNIQAKLDDSPSISGSGKSFILAKTEFFEPVPDVEDVKFSLTVIKKRRK